jgi:hypothetical protein
MQTLIAHSAVWRAVALFAGMLMGKIAWNTRPAGSTGCGELVSWCAGAQSRREDELARSRQTESS